MRNRSPRRTPDLPSEEQPKATRRGLNGKFGEPSAYQPWTHLTDEERDVYRRRSSASAMAKARALRGEGPEPVHEVNVPRLDPLDLMPALADNGLAALSLFSGGGGLDLGFERAGFAHAASYEIIDDAAETLRRARPQWTVFGGDAGDVRQVDWRKHRGSAAVIHGGPPCQPFSSAGRQRGRHDPRDMWPEFARAVLEARPEAFVAENVSALLHGKFERYVQETIVRPLSAEYTVSLLTLKAESFGIPQVRKRVFFVGFRSSAAAKAFRPPEPIHTTARADAGQAVLPLLEPSNGPQRCMGARDALGLPDLGYDALAPTLRCTWTGPRGTTSVLSSVSALRAWGRLMIWPNGVAPDREKARAFVPKNRHFRLSVPDCGLLQGFPESWPIYGAVYIALGQIGNAVPPPMAYRVAAAVAQALG